MIDLHDHVFFFLGGGWRWPELQRWNFVAQILSMDHGRTSEQTAKIDEGPKDSEGVYMGRLVLVKKINVSQTID